MKATQEGSAEHLRGGVHRVRLVLELTDEEWVMWQAARNGEVPGLKLEATLRQGTTWTVEKWQGFPQEPGR